eukprot:364809-Chlamydomonas_euryale.AAC.29
MLACRLDARLSGTERSSAAAAPLLAHAHRRPPHARAHVRALTRPTPVRLAAPAEWDVRQFRGGETMILRPGVLDYWGSLYSAGYGLEMDSLMELVEPVFNRLTVFDPRCGRQLAA